MITWIYPFQLSIKWLYNIRWLNAELYISPKSEMPGTTSRNASLTTYIISFATFVCLFALSYSWIYLHKDPKGCAMTYMYPNYIQQKGFRSSSTKDPDRYNLYLYRDGRYDRFDKLIGTPVLFIPGHAGSYKQIRSIASVAASMLHDSRSLDSGAGELDFFTVDFNEELSAFHGPTLLAQATYINDAIAYILSLYSPQSNSSCSISLVGHSMGGFLARLIFTISNYNIGTVNTILTLSTPHLLPPITLDRLTNDLYNRTNHFWRINSNNSLDNVILVSIAGGNLDGVLSSDLVTLGTGPDALVPRSRGFTVFTTGVPHVWTGADHRAVLWCNQIAKAVASALLAVSAAQCEDPSVRLRGFEKILLSGFEEGEVTNAANNDVKSRNSWIGIAPIETGEVRELKWENSIHFSNTSSTHGAMDLLRLIPIASSCSDSPCRINLLLPGIDESQIAICQHGVHYQVVADEGLGCRPIFKNVAVIPANDERLMYDAERDAFRFVTVVPQEIGGGKFIGIKSTQKFHTFSSDTSFLIAEVIDDRETEKCVNISMIEILLHGVSITLPHAQLYTRIRIVPIRNQLFAYHFTILSRLNPNRNGTGFKPILRQSFPWAITPESKFYIIDDSNQLSKVVEISFYGRPVFMPPSTTTPDGLLLELWLDSDRYIGEVEVRLHIDLYGSIGIVFSRYHMSILCFSLVIVLIVGTKQANEFSTNGTMLDFPTAFICSLKTTIPIFFLLVVVISILQHIFITNNRHILLFGSLDPLLWLLILAIFILSIGITAILWTTLDIIIIIVSLPFYPFSRLFFLVSPRLSPLFTILRILIILTFSMTILPVESVFLLLILNLLFICARDRAQSRSHTHDTLLLLYLLLFLPCSLPPIIIWVQDIIHRGLNTHSISFFTISQLSPQFLVNLVIYILLAEFARLEPRRHRFTINFGNTAVLLVSLNLIFTRIGGAMDLFNDAIIATYLIVMRFNGAWGLCGVGNKRSREIMLEKEKNT